MKLSKHLRSAFTVMLMLVGVTFGQTAGATTKTYTVTGGNGGSPTEFYALFSDGSSSSGQVNWTYNSTAEISFSLPGGLTLKLSNTAKQLVYSNGAIGGRGATTFTVSSSTYYIYRVRLLDSSGDVIQLDANGNAVNQGGVSECDYWNMTKSFSHTFSNGILFSKIEVSYATAIPITDAVITGLNSQYPVSNAAVTPTPTVTWHGTTLTNGTHYSLTYQNNTAAGTATVYATGKGIFSTSTSVSADYTLVWATYSVRFNKNNDAATGTMSNQAFTYSTAQALAANAFTRTGYTFAGWNTAANCSGTSYTDGQSVSNLTATNGGTVDLYAQWTQVWTGSGTQGDPYVITTTAGLDLLAKYVNGTDGYTANDFSDTYFKLGDDISYTHTTDWNNAASTENNYTAIGGRINDSNRYFRGTFDGQGHTVSGIRIYKGGATGADSYQGLFGMTRGATIRNVILADARITGKQYVGGIAGYI
ncbi:MAG: InlB B-repeat-containing protein, partial [Bacteroidaceae bacterium]|nr:InlB B-repeat-containing protein [Bacteroidaceae bacterium]